MPFNIYDMANKFAPAAGVLAVIISIVLGTLAHFGYMDSASSSREDNHNVVIRVTDQHGFPRVCALSIVDANGKQQDIARSTGNDGVYSDSLAPGTTVTFKFDCAPGKDRGTQIAEVDVTAPTAGVLRKDITIPNPSLTSASSKYALGTN